MRTLVLLAIVAACACASPDIEPSIAKARPPWAPMTGGSTIELYGEGFDPHVNRVFVGGREASVVRTIDDTRLDIVVPPSEQAGDVEIVVVTSTRNVIATGIFRYSEPPTVDSVTPARVIASAPTTISVHGRGFIDEEAGDPIVLVDGTPLADVTVRSDSLLVFDAPPGVPFSRAQIEVINQRGRANKPGYVHALTDRPGLLAFNNNTSAFATFYDPIDQLTIEIPYVSSARPCIYGVIGDGAGTYYASDYCSFGDWGFGRIDLAAQRSVDGIVHGRLYPTIARHRGVLYAIEYQSNRFGTLAASGDSFTQIGTVTAPCCSVGLASDDATMWLVAQEGVGPTIRTIDPESGVTGPSVPLVPPTAVSDLRWFAGTIYATTSSGSLHAIDPATGTVTTIGFVGSTHALEVLE
ncbi:MAG: IPT/TIG domain-containing protein [Kofleriaceae bacterium]